MVDVKKRVGLNNRRMMFIFLIVFASLLIVPAGAIVNSITCLAGLKCSPNPILTAGNITLLNSTTNSIGGIEIANCTSGSFVRGWDGNISPLCGPSASVGSIVLLFDNDTETSITGNGNCYNYTLATNTYSQILIDARGVINSLPTSALNLSIFYGTSLVESQGVSNTIISGALTIPISVEYNQNQTTSVLIQVNATNASGSPVLTCKSFYVWGIV